MGFGDLVVVKFMSGASWTWVQVLPLLLLIVTLRKKSALVPQLGGGGRGCVCLHLSLLAII